MPAVLCAPQTHPLCLSMNARYWAGRQQAGESDVAHIVDELRSASALLQSQLGMVEKAAAEFKALAQGIEAAESHSSSTAAARRHRANLIMALS